jgi:hypothetical protein
VGGCATGLAPFLEAEAVATDADHGGAVEPGGVGRVHGGGAEFTKSLQSARHMSALLFAGLSLGDERDLCAGLRRPADIGRKRSDPSRASARTVVLRDVFCVTAGTGCTCGSPAVEWRRSITTELSQCGNGCLRTSAGARILAKEVTSMNVKTDLKGGGVLLAD